MLSILHENLDFSVDPQGMAISKRNSLNGKETPTILH